MKLTQLKKLFQENKPKAGLAAAIAAIAAIGAFWSGLADLGMWGVANRQHSMEVQRIYSSARPILRTKVEVKVLDDKERGGRQKSDSWIRWNRIEGTDSFYVETPSIFRRVQGQGRDGSAQGRADAVGAGQQI